MCYNRAVRIYMVILSISYELTIANPVPSTFASFSSYKPQYVKSPRLSIVEWNQYNERNLQEPDTYAFGYDVQNPDTDDVHFRHEERLANGTVVGSYGYVTPDGSAHHVRYTADSKGYRATIETTKRLADVKPIPVDVDQALADELASAQLALQNEKAQGAQITTFDSEKQNNNNDKQAVQRTRFNLRSPSVKNKKEQVDATRNNLAEALSFTGSY